MNDQAHAVMAKLPHLPPVKNIFGDLEGWLVGVFKVQIVLGMLMQLSYVAFPAYNFVLGIWGFASHSSSDAIQKNHRLVTLFAAVVALSILADLIWSILWISGKVFFSQTCGSTRVTLVTCGSSLNSYPGCKTNRFAFAMLFLNIWVKLITLGCLFKAYNKCKKTKQMPTQSELPTVQNEQNSPENPATVQPTSMNGENLELPSAASP